MRLTITTLAVRLQGMCIVNVAPCAVVVFFAVRACTLYHADCFVVSLAMRIESCPMVVCDDRSFPFEIVMRNKVLLALRCHHSRESAEGRCASGISKEPIGRCGFRGVSNHKHPCCLFLHCVYFYVTLSSSSTRSRRVGVTSSSSHVDIVDDS